jgi:deoxyribodipyrimidine photo-lyase
LETSPEKQEMAVVAKQRVRTLSDAKTVEPRHGGITYWMSRDQRVEDNWALLYAQELARKHGVGLSVVFCMVPSFLGATMRMYDFMLTGLEEVESSLHALGVPFRLLMGAPGDALPAFVQRHSVCAIVTDFSPLRIGAEWKAAVCRKLPDMPLFEVDAHVSGLRFKLTVA